MPNFDVSIFVSGVILFCTLTQIHVHIANSGDPDQTRRSVASDQVLHRLQMSTKCLMTEPILILMGVRKKSCTVNEQWC